MAQFAAGKLLDFFRHFDPSKPQCIESVRRLERSMTDKAPELLTDEAYWVQAWRTKPTPPPFKVVSVDIRDHVKVQSQSNGVSCGQCSCAMAINALTGRQWTDLDFDRNYGFGLLAGLMHACPDHAWRDAGNLSRDLWPEIGQALASECPVVVGLNGPMFSPSGRGHIVLIVGLSPTEVTFVDPNGGLVRQCSRGDMESARDYPGGKFVFVARPR